MLKREIIFFICLGLLMLSLPGTSLHAASVKPAGPPANNQSNTLNNSPQMNDIHDIKSLEKYGTNPALLWYGLLGVIIIALLTAAFMFWKKRKKTIVEVEASISPQESALNMLNDLHALMNSDGKKFYFQLSMILREYIRHRFGVGAPEMTTEELLPRIAELELEGRLLQGAREFVLVGDPVKFANQPAETETMQRHLAFVRSFVEQTTPASAEGDFEPSPENNDRKM